MDKTGLLPPLLERALYTMIGTTGHVSLPDKSIAKKRKLKPLNRVEMWILMPIIEVQKSIRRDAFEDVMRKYLGTDFD